MSEDLFGIYVHRGKPHVVQTVCVPFVRYLSLAINLNAKNSRTFFDALATPVKFNRKLTEALEAFRRRQRE